MNLDDAELLSLMQRNLEICRTSADTAEMLLRQYMERFTKNYYHKEAASPAYAGEAASAASVPLLLPVRKKSRKRAAPVKAKRKINYPATRKPAKRGSSKTPLSHERLIFGDYLDGHNGTFRLDDVLEWAGKKGFAYDKSKLQSVVYNMANQKKSLTSNGQGEYQKV